MSIAYLDPLLLAGVVIVVAFITDRYLRKRSPRAQFLVRLLSFVALTALMVAGGVVPYQPGLGAGAEPRRFIIAALKVLWWLGAAWLTAGFLRAFLVAGGQPRQTRLVQDLLAALSYVGALLVILASVFDVPVRGLLVTSGALAIIVGLALQSSLGDVFSGIFLSLERPYSVGDWIILDDTVQGKVIDTDWRATHILTPNGATAIIPNSLIAKSKLVNCSVPAQVHWTTVNIRLRPSLTTPAAGCQLLREVLLGSTHILQAPAPCVTVRDISEEIIDFELAYAVTNVGAIPDAQNEIFDRVYRAVAVAGGRFAPRLAPFIGASQHTEAVTAAPERLFAGISLFASLTMQEKIALQAQMQRKEYKRGELIVRSGTVLEALCLISEGILARTVQKDGREREVVRLSPGDYFGELGMLTGEPLQGEITALTPVVIYEISKGALTPLLKARPAMAEQLSESLARRQLAMRTVLERTDNKELRNEDLARPMHEPRLLAC